MDKFVGRQHELGALEEELRRVREGQPRVVLVQAARPLHREMTAVASSRDGYRRGSFPFQERP